MDLLSTGRSLSIVGVHREWASSRHQPTVEWLGWSHERVFPDIKIRATGRVELGARAGSIHISDVKLAASPVRLNRLFDVLDATYPKTRWFLFGAGYRGEPAKVVLAGRRAAV